MLSQISLVDLYEANRLICCLFRYSESMKPFERVIHPEEWWLYKNPKIENQVFSTIKLYVRH